MKLWLYRTTMKCDKAKYHTMMLEYKYFRNHINTLMSHTKR